MFFFGKKHSGDGYRISVTSSPGAIQRARVGHTQDRKDGEGGGASTGINVLVSVDLGFRLYCYKMTTIFTDMVKMRCRELLCKKNMKSVMQAYILKK